ncbi:TIGR02391 family protein [Spirosoma sp. RP8]|uniref:TIGR02391 family protein n=1 Tax=Spirosoma liriopis TaxID=2937440 RepID=A0ABT0HLS1_9BACT|nr:TIGR02391 family protein [Spirosoma liriopis]MCK8493124.1 TIGR02391 family protein [Spirosoma liriopis]
MNKVELYDQILDFILDINSGFQASPQNIKKRLRPDLEEFQIQDLLEDMNSLAPKYFSAKNAGRGNLVLFKNERTPFLKKEGGFAALAAKTVIAGRDNGAVLNLINAGSMFAQLHPRVQEVAGPYFLRGLYKAAVSETCTALSEAVEKKTELSIDNTKLMQRAFASDNPILKLSDVPAERIGFQQLFVGAMMAIRNPLAHRLADTYTDQTALEWLSFLSALFRLVDEAEVINAP